MAEDLAHQKRVQGALSLGTAALGLSALGSKGGAVAARQVMRRAPKTAAKLRLTPKAAENMDKTSLGLVTTASGLGGASGIHFASLQRAEAKKEEQMKAGLSKSAFGVYGVVSKDVVDLEAKRDEAAAKYQRILGQRNEKKAIEQGRFLKYGEEREHESVLVGDPSKNARYEDRVNERIVPDTNRPRKAPAHKFSFKPKPAPIRAGRRPSEYGGLNPEKRRQQRMRIEQHGAEAGAAGAGLLTAGYAGNALSDRRTARRAAGQAVISDAQRAGRANAAWLLNPNNKQMAASASREALQHAKDAKLHEAIANTAGRFARTRTKQAVGAGLLTAGLAGTAAGIRHMRTKGQGRTYTDWWDG